MGGYFAWNSFFSGLLYIVVIVSGGFFIAGGTLEVAELVIYILYINIYVRPLDVLINFTEQFPERLRRLPAFFDILETARIS
jgi:ATP-binding cassette subfamily B protein